jgi:shikimate kinase
MHVYLTGFMGAGKTSVGRILAARLGWGFVDLDELIEKRASMTISEIFERLGEPKFRRMEESALRQIAESESTVVATGGGTMIEPKNRQIFKERGVTVWLDIPLSTVVKRLAGQDAEKRPLFSDLERVAELYENRLVDYETSDVHIEIEPETHVQDVAESVRKILETRRCDT